MTWWVGRAYAGYVPWGHEKDWDDGDTWTGWEREPDRELRDRERRWRDRDEEEESSSDNSLRRGQRRQEEEAPRSTQGRLFGPSPAEAAREGLQEGQKGKSKGA